MLANFRTYRLAVEFHHSVCAIKFPSYLKDQILRASSSVALNLAEGSSRQTFRDKQKFYNIALSSLRECQAALDLSPLPYSDLVKQADTLGASLYRLCHPK